MASQNQYDVLSEDDDDNYDPTKTQSEETKINGKSIDKMKIYKEYFWDASSSDESNVEDVPKMDDTVCGTRRNHTSDSEEDKVATKNQKNDDQKEMETDETLDLRTE